MLKSKYILLAITLLLCGIALILPSVKTSALAASNYTDHLIDDGVFKDINSMGSGPSGSQNIQNFLNNTGSGLAGFSDIEDCGSPSGSHYSYYATYYACGQRASAAQIIFAAGQAYGISPRVILATLQKEQSLITTPNPTASQLNYAMGYGCPDSGGCSYAGFFNQVDNAAWQFRTDMELGSGNNWWGYTPASYPCNGATRYYSAALKANAAETFYDNNAVAYTSFTLPNMSTATLYCYTPHAYNNPNGLYGNPQYGTTGEYFSGSYNFVYYFTLWWGSTYVPSFQATYAGQSGYPTIVKGGTSPAYFKYQNTGNLPWYDDVSAPQLHTYPVHLATSNPLNGASPFSANWPANNRATGTFAHVYESDGTTLAANQHVATPGQIIEFDFTFTANTDPGYYKQYFQPVLEGSTMWNMGGLAWLGVTVQPMTFQASYAGESNFPSIGKGQSSPAYFRFKNTGNMAWYDDISAPQFKTYSVHLATTNPINRSSQFSAGWPSNNRASGSFAKVFESDGTTLSSNQHIAQPGQIVEYDFNFTVPSNASSGTYQEYFQPILEGSVFWNMGGTVWLGVTAQ